MRTAGLPRYWRKYRAQNSREFQGHKWTVQALWRYFEEIGVDHSVILAKIKDLVIKTMISGEKPMTSMFEENAKNRYLK